MADAYYTWRMTNERERVRELHRLRAEKVKLIAQIRLCKEDLKPETVAAFVEAAERNCPNLN